MKIFRKGDIEINLLGIMILAVIILFVSVAFYKNVIDTSKDIAKSEACKRSVQFSNIKLKPDNLEGAAQAIYDMFKDQFGNPVRLDCATRYVHIKGDDPEAYKTQIADEMVLCWDTYGQGLKELFDTKDNNYCVICSRMTFEENEKIMDFTAFLQDHEPRGKGKTYWKHLMGVEMIDFQATHYENSKLRQYDNFNTDFPLAVMYLLGKDAYPDAFIEASNTEGALWMSGGGLIVGVIAGGLLCSTGVGCGAVLIMATAVGGTGVGAGFGYLIGSDRSADWDARIGLWNYNEIKDLDCTYMEARSTPLKIVEQPLIEDNKKNI